MTTSATSFPVEETSIGALHAAYLSGRATALSVCQAHLDRIAAYDRRGPALGAIIVNNPNALADAAALDAALASTGKLIGPLHGIPVLVKDNYDVAGLQTTGGSAALLGWIPEADATVIARIRAAGGVILAKTTMSEWARGGLDNINSVLPGFARNPYNTAYATGGSSGGTGSGLAASFGVVGLGSDTFGSIRNPASNNALVGLRTSWALVFSGRYGWTLRQARHRRSDGPHRHRSRATTRRHRRCRPSGPGDRRGGWQNSADLHGISESGRCRGSADRRASSGVPTSCLQSGGPRLVRPCGYRLAACRGRNH